MVSCRFMRRPYRGPCRWGKWPGPSQPLAQPHRVVDRGVDVAGGDGVADAVEEVGAVGVGRQLGGGALDEAVEVDLAAVAGAGAQLVVDLVGRQDPVLDDDVVDLALDGLFAVLVPQGGDEAVALAPDGAQLEGGGEPDAVAGGGGPGGWGGWGG